MRLRAATIKNVIGARGTAARRSGWAIGSFGSLALCACHLVLPYDHGGADAQTDRLDTSQATPADRGLAAEQPVDLSLSPADLPASPADATGDGSLPDAEPQPCDPNEVYCGGICVDPATDPNHCGGCGNPCSSGVCLGGSCALRVFVTANVFSGSLGGLSGADGKCNAGAQQAGLPGSYRAWLSTDTASPTTRLTRGAYVLVTKALVAASWADLTDGTLDAAIDVTEGSVHLSGTQTAWTNTLVSGAAAGTTHCAGWTSSGMTAGKFGNVLGKGATWTEAGDAACSIQRRLYCFQQ